MSTSRFDPMEHLSEARKGGPKDYLPVKWRVVWLRSEHPDATIVTEALQVSEEFAVFRAEVTLANGARATGHGSESTRDFRDHIEKAETKAVGRALANLGFGTEHAAEMDEGDGADGEKRIADAPMKARPAPPARPEPPARPTGPTLDQLRAAFKAAYDRHGWTVDEVQALLSARYPELANADGFIASAVLNPQQLSEMLDVLRAGKPKAATGVAPAAPAAKAEAALPV